MSLWHHRIFSTVTPIEADEYSARHQYNILSGKCRKLLGTSLSSANPAPIQMRPDRLLLLFTALIELMFCWCVLYGRYVIVPVNLALRGQPNIKSWGNEFGYCMHMLSNTATLLCCALGWSRRKSETGLLWKDTDGIACQTQWWKG